MPELTRAAACDRLATLMGEVDQLEDDRSKHEVAAQHVSVQISECRVEMDGLMRDMPDPDPLEALDEAEALANEPEAVPDAEGPEEPAQEPEPAAVVPPIDEDNWETYPLSDLGLSDALISVFHKNSVMNLGQLSRLIEDRVELTSLDMAVSDAALVSQRYGDWYNSFEEAQKRVHLDPVAGAR